MDPAASQERRFFAPDWPAAFVQAAVLLVFSVLITALVWGLRSERLPLTADQEVYRLELPVDVVDVAAAIDLYDAGDHLFVDVRNDDERGKTTIPGAFRSRASRFDDDLFDLIDIVYPEDPIVLFGTGDLVGPAHVADLLLARGFEDVQILRGSMAAWRNADGEISPTAEVQP